MDEATDVVTLFRDENLGCKRAVESAITWFLSHEPEGIILEDDCVPSSSFFDFCDLMLDRYRDESRVMHISGYSHRSEGADAYHYSRFPSVWGWATWRSAWNHYPTTLPRMTEELVRILRSTFASADEHRFFVEKFHQVALGQLDTWDFSWAYAVMSRQAITIRPAKNLVANIGVGDSRAAHTTRSRAVVSENLAREMDCRQLAAPTLLLTDFARDEEYFRRMIAGRLRLVRSLRRRFRHRPPDRV
jgi:hypothetical protein